MDATGEHPPEPAAWVVRRDQPVRLGDGVTICLEAGGEIQVHGVMPPETPLGYHTLVHPDGRERSLIVGPGACFLPEELRTWGWGTQLYAARSRRSWGIGDFSDLRRLGEWARSEGAGMLLVNPLHAALPTEEQQTSPYTPSSRRFRNPLYLSIEDLPGASETGVDLTELVAQGRALNHRELIDRDTAYRLKMDALARIYERAPHSEDFERYLRSGGELLRSYATFVSLAEHYGGGATRWPNGYERPDSSAVARWQRDNAERIRFHAWVQWLLEGQLEEAMDAIDIVHDLAIGVDPEGADAWIWQDVLAAGVSVGAPPDEFNSLGQDWSLPPFDPWKLRASGYRAFIETIRSGMAGAGLRFDHVMGLFRLFWIPNGLPAAEGTYVRYPYEDLLNILALESHRANAYVVGEDLGTVEPFVREEMQRRNIMGYRVLWFESDPEAYPESTMAAVTNHDLPTIAGLWTGSDLRMQQILDLQPNVEATTATRDRLRDLLGLADDAPVEEVVVRTHELLSRAPSRLLVPTLEDALGVEERPNQPGTTDERPNWSVPLPFPLEEVFEHPLPRRVARTLGHRR
ncbi:MAG: 4-alpha-glucanotransferase [Actinobacteria bacterium]|nr:4-alpha-glucanotransferase [Actinomycetota bacterium]